MIGPSCANHPHFADIWVVDRTDPRLKGKRMAARRLLLTISTMLLLCGCYYPRGAWYAHVGQAATYWSTESRPTTITILDTRTMEPFFTVEIPVGKELVLNFKEGEGDNEVQTPDLMLYEVFELGKTTGTLHNSMSIPDRFSRRIDVTYRPAPEYAKTPPDEQDRIDQSKPDWWSPEGGPKPNNAALEMYDGKK